MQCNHVRLTSGQIATTSFKLTTDSCVQFVQYTKNTTPKAADNIVQCTVRLHFHRTCRRQGLNCLKLYPLAVRLPYSCSVRRRHGRHRTEPSREAHHRVAAGKVHLYRLTVQPHAGLPFPLMFNTLKLPRETDNNLSYRKYVSL